MKKLSVTLIIFALLFSGCEQSDIGKLNLRGTINGRVRVIDEFGYPVDKDNVVVELEGSKPVLSALTDSNGKFEIHDVPTGTYNIILSKEGYGEFQKQGFQMVGGKAPAYIKGTIKEKSSTTINDLSLKIVNGSDVYITGVVNHNYNFETHDWLKKHPLIRYFIHKEDNPSYINYLETRAFRFEGESGSRMESYVPIDNNMFPSGTRIYIVAYGNSIYENQYYDILMDQYIYSSVGIPSNVATIAVP